MSVFRTSFILLKTLKTVPYVLKRSNTLIPQHLFDSIAVVVGYADSEETELFDIEACKQWYGVGAAYIGTWYFNGMHDFALDKEKGLQFIKQAADQRYPGGLFDTNRNICII